MLTAMKSRLVFVSLICLALSATVIDSTSKAAGQYRQIQMFINQKTAYIDGKSIELEAPPTIINNKTVVPLRFLQENAMPTCAETIWDQRDRKITLNIPSESLDCDTILNMQKELDKLKAENTDLKDQLEKAKRGETPQENTVPPIVYGPKNGIKFTFKSIVKDRDGIRIDVVVDNIADSYCRFPASLTKITLDGKEYAATSWDSAFRERINPGKRQPGYIRFPIFPTTGIAKFKFFMWPENTLKYFDFDIKVDLEQSIPALAK